MIQKLINVLLDFSELYNEGFTFTFEHKQGLNYFDIQNLSSTDKNRYIISVESLLEIKKDSDKTIITYYNNNLKALKTCTEPLIIGGWFNKENNTYYIDYVTTENNLEIALLIAKIFNQKAIYDNKTKEVINVQKL